MIRKTRRGSAGRVSAVLVLGSLLLVTASPAGAHPDGDSTATGGGTMYGNHPQPQATPPGGSGGAFPCAAYDYLDYTSRAPVTGTSDYTVNYTVDNGASSGTYTGLVVTEYRVGLAGDGVLIYEGPGGSYESQTECELGLAPGAQYGVTDGYIQSITALQMSTPGLRCDYDGGTYSRIGTLVTVELDGTCDDPADGATHEHRQSEQTPVGPAPRQTAGPEVLTATPGP